MELSRSAHVDTFCRDNLPPQEQWPEFRFDLPELRYPERLNCASALLDDVVAAFGPDRPCLRTDAETSQFILVTEQDKAMQAPGYDHLGFLYETRAEVDLLLEKCKKRQAQDARVQIKEYEDLVTGRVSVHAFYVRFLLPIWFDVQTIEYAPGSEPKRGWRFA